MRFRLIVSLPLSLAIVGLLLVSASTLFAAVGNAPPSTFDGSAAPAARETAGTAMHASAESIERAVPAEARCDRLRQEIRALSHEVTPCELAPECLGSPLLCPIALDPRIEREYARLRETLQAECGLSPGLPGFAWAAGAEVDLGERCEVAHDGREAAARGERALSTYTF